MAKFNKDAGAALVFGVLYLVLWVWMASGYLTGRYKLRSRWTLLAFHVTVRVASQVRTSLPFTACYLLAMVLVSHVPSQPNCEWYQ
jgi:hypothetical protein